MSGKRGRAPLVCVTIVNYRGREFLPELLASLRAQTFRDFEILFIDNASGDGSCEYVARRFPEVQVLAQDKNLGFAVAGNLAARHCRSRYFALLNTDLKLDPTWLLELVSTAEREQAAATASKMRLYSRPHLLNGVGGAMNRLGYTWDRGMYEEDKGQYDRIQEVLFASAGAALFRRSTFLEAGGFDDSFFMYHEDVDLCWRLWIQGHRVVTAPSAVVYHHFGGATQKTRSMLWRELLGERNSIRSLLKNYEWRNALKALRGIILLSQSPRRKWGQIRNLLWNLWKLPDTLRRRHAVQKARRRPDRELGDLIVQSPDVPLRL
ncbi:MAG TPA: glycosyltransferase family 2 protein [Acidobacteriota bacterium]|nr:glycosyltransferase family 2 protein [Acidobacteriota bacterium]